jgi:hypothetical protein
LFGKLHFTPRFLKFSPLTDAVTVFITVRISFDRFNLADSTIS